MSTESMSGAVFFFIKGGPLMWPILILSVIALTIVLIKFWGLRRFRTRLDSLTEKLTTLVEGGNIPAALKATREETSALGRIFENAVLHRMQERSELTRRLERLGGDVVAELELYMNALASIIGVAPMIGFLGTIVGLIKAFMNWETIGDKITINLLAGGIYEAMITTAAGLLVAIPYYLLYNHLVGKIAKLTRLTEERAEEFVDLIADTNVKEPARHAL